MSHCEEEGKRILGLILDGNVRNNSNRDTGRFGRDRALQHIQSMLVDVLTQLTAAYITFPCRQSFENSSDVPNPSQLSKKIQLQVADRRKRSSHGITGTRTISYPRNSPHGSAKSLVLDIMNDALVYDVPVTKRDIFYRDVLLFRSQAVVDRLVDDLSATFKLNRADLNVRATSKGLVCGSGLAIQLLDGARIYVNHTEGTLIPVSEDISNIDLETDISWILIIEKDAIFQTLCRLKLTDHPLLPGRGIMITGKGYPDMATRQLVKTFADHISPKIPIMALVDCDAYGIDILSVYKYGSLSLRHENETMAVRCVEWIGVWASELDHLCIHRDSLIPITIHDEKKAISMLNRPQSVMPEKWRKELMHMLHSRRKAEIEILSTSRSPLECASHRVAIHSFQRNFQPIFKDNRYFAGCGSEQGPVSPFLRYLANKISDCITTHRDL